MKSLFAKTDNSIFNVQKSCFLLCYHVFIVLDVFLAFSQNNPTGVWLRLIVMHN